MLLKCSEILGCKIGELPISYLGMPLCSRWVTKSLWNPVVERVERKLFSWKATYLSIGGRVPLIKYVLSNLPVYYFSIFRCPVSIIKRLERLQIDFLWHGTSSQKKLHLVDWESICKPKDEGGLGIRPLKKMNQALLGKWLWRIGEGSQGLWRRVLERKCSLPRCGWDVQDPPLYSFTIWKGILSVKKLFMENIKYQIGLGERTLFGKIGGQVKGCCVLNSHTCLGVHKSRTQQSILI